MSHKSGKVPGMAKRQSGKERRQLRQQTKHDEILRGLTVVAENNGDTPVTGIPDDLVWDEGNPPIIFPCSQHTSHEEGCNGDCGEPIVTTESIVNLLNEGRAYARAGMHFVGLPVPLRGGPFSGIPVEIYDLELRVLLMQDILIEAGIVSRDELDERFRVFKFQKLRELREQVEPGLKKARLEAQFGVKKPGLLGPDGRPIG